MKIITLPGLIDPHVHLRDPGQTQKENFYTGTSAALAGGYTTVLDMPNNIVPITTRERLLEKIAIAKEKIVCDVGFYFGSLGDNLDEFEKINPLRQLADGGKVMGLKLYLNHTTGNLLLDKKNLSRVFSAWPLALPILVHAEKNAVADVLQTVKETGHKVHICHVVSEELKLVMQAKEAGLPITCGVTPHHLFLTKDDENLLGSFALMKPPLQSKEDVAFLWKNLKSIDVIESDHAPHTLQEKQSKNPPFGVPNLETTLPLLLTAASEGRLTINDIIRLCHTNPARIFGVTTDPTTKVEVDLDTKYEIQNANLFTKCGWSPFNGWSVKGKITRVVLRGKTVFENGKIIATPGSGKILQSRGI